MFSAGPRRPELVGDAIGEEILLVRDHRADDADRVHQIAARPDEVMVIGVVARAGEEADQARVGGGIAAGVFQRGPGDFEKDAVLRIQDLRFLGRDAEERAVEPLRLVDQAARARRSRAARAKRCRIVAGRGELFVGEMGDAILARDEISPELGGVRAPRENAPPDR